VGQDIPCTNDANKRLVLDAAMTLGLHIEAYWRCASEANRRE
jgi:hypothetical protein